ncbi:GNAT family N-acetyltransferase [Candidatus Zixiibacteriota bacterium]
MEYTVRKAAGEDYRGLCAVLREIESLHQRKLPDVFLEHPKPIWPEQFVLDTLSEDNAELFIAESDGRIVGFLRVMIRQTPEFPFLVPRRYAFIDTIVVTETARGCGVGKTLMRRAHQWAVDKKLNQIRLNVWEFNEGAIQFYEKLGYISKTRQMWKSLDMNPATLEAHDEPGS